MIGGNGGGRSYAPLAPGAETRFCGFDLGTDLYTSPTGDAYSATNDNKNRGMTFSSANGHRRLLISLSMPGSQNYQDVYFLVCVNAGSTAAAQTALSHSNNTGAATSPQTTDQGCFMLVPNSTIEIVADSAITDCYIAGFVGIGGAPTSGGIIANIQVAAGR